MYAIRSYYEPGLVGRLILIQFGDGHIFVDLATNSTDAIIASFGHIAVTFDVGLGNIVGIV